MARAALRTVKDGVRVWYPSGIAFTVIIVLLYGKSGGRKFTPKRRAGLSMECYSAADCGGRFKSAATPSEKSGHALFQHHDAVFDPRRPHLLLQQLQRLFHRLVRQPEASIVHRNHPARFQIKKSSRSIGGISMHVAERWRIVGANGKQRQLRRQAPPNLAKACEISRVAGVIHRMLPCLQHIAAIATMRILQNSCSPMP